MTSQPARVERAASTRRSVLSLRNLTEPSEREVRPTGMGGTDARVDLQHRMRRLVDPTDMFRPCQRRGLGTIDPGERESLHATIPPREPASASDVPGTTSEFAQQEGVRSPVQDFAELDGVEFDQGTVVTRRGGP